jgi:YD repeat-containing protein
MPGPEHITSATFIYYSYDGEGRLTSKTTDYGGKNGVYTTAYRYRLDKNGCVRRCDRGSVYVDYYLYVDREGEKPSRKPTPRLPRLGTINQNTPLMATPGLQGEERGELKRGQRVSIVEVSSRVIPFGDNDVPPAPPYRVEAEGAAGWVFALAGTKKGGGGEKYINRLQLSSCSFLRLRQHRYPRVRRGQGG